MARLAQLLSNIDSTLKHVIAELGEPDIKGGEDIDKFYHNYGFKESIKTEKATEGNVPGLVSYLTEWAAQIKPENIDDLIKEQKKIAEAENRAAQQAHEKMPEPYKSQKKGRPDIQAERDAQARRKDMLDAREGTDDDTTKNAEKAYDDALMKHAQVKDAYVKWESHKYAAQKAEKDLQALKKKKDDITTLSAALFTLPQNIQSIEKSTDTDEKRKRFLAFKQKVIQVAHLAQSLV